MLEGLFYVLISRTSHIHRDDDRITYCDLLWIKYIDEKDS